MVAKLLTGVASNDGNATERVVNNVNNLAKSTRIFRARKVQ